MDIGHTPVLDSEVLLAHFTGPDWHRGFVLSCPKIPRTSSRGTRAILPWQQAFVDPNGRAFAGRATDRDGDLFCSARHDDLFLAEVGLLFSRRGADGAGCVPLLLKVANYVYQRLCDS